MKYGTLDSGKKIRSSIILNTARIFNLREQGNAIITKNVTRKGKTFAEYSLLQ